MIKQNGNLYSISTLSTTMLVRVNDNGKVTTEYYGKRLPDGVDLSSVLIRYGAPKGRSVVYCDKQPNISLNDMPSDFSLPLKGDYNNPSLILEGGKSFVYDFVFASANISSIQKMEGYPTPHDGEKELTLILEDKLSEASLELHYLCFEHADVIGRYVKIVNHAESALHVKKAASMQLVIDDKGYELVSFYGNWVGEWTKDVAPISHFRYAFDSNTGSSCDYRQPFFMLKRRNASHQFGEAYGFNLIYSGNHLEEVEMNSYSQIRIQNGISALYFDAKLEKEESFLTPLSVMAYSSEGTNGIAHHMHAFVKENVLPKEWAAKPRPVLFNNWEGTYFKFDEGKILSLAKEAKALGCELFCLDDGWFGQRNDEKSSLGDWFVNTKKLPHGIDGLAKKIHKMGMKFGLWFEPEAVSPNSKLYEAHPDWAIKEEGREPALSRFQLTLDLTKKEVRDYIVESLSSIIDTAKIDYIKWDYNRVMSDLPSNDGLFFHKYILGLYEVLDRLVEKFPTLQMENCASGGARNDLGMFSYFCQGWVSDDTDSFQRSSIQANAGLALPPCVLSNHVSAKTSHQMLRKTSLGTKFDVAAMGVLGYELNLADLDPIDRHEVKAQIEFYKKHRDTLQFGTWDLLDGLDESNRMVLELHGEDEALVSYVLGIQRPSVMQETLPLTGLDEDKVYFYRVRDELNDFRRFGGLVNMVAPIHIKEEGKLVNFISRRKGMPIEKFEGSLLGAALNADSLRLPLLWSGTGMGDDVRVLGDFGARLYLFSTSPIAEKSEEEVKAEQADEESK